MASITKDNTTNGKYRVRAIDSNGEDVELFFDTHIEAQAVANVETKNQLDYYDELERNKDNPTYWFKDGHGFQDWLKKRAEQLG